MSGYPSAADIAAAVSDPIIVIDREGLVTAANAAARASFGALDPGTPLLLRFRSPEMQKLLHAALDDPARAGQADYVERVPLERHYRVSVAPTVDSGLRILIFRDRSELRRIDRMRADFVANASHELRTPLASIAGFIDTLRGPARNDEPAREKFLEVMQAQTERMARLIDDLLSLSRLEMKPLLDPNRTVDLAEIVGTCVRSMAPLAQSTDVSIDYEAPTGEMRATGSRDELTQVVENLLQNAFKYGGSGGSVVVSLQREPESGEIRISVADRGPGIAEEHIPRLTERFYRVEQAEQTQKGTGLGLAIVKHILTRHNGYLSIRSELGKGSTFTVHLPAA